MNLPADIKNLLEDLKVDPDRLSRLKDDLYIQCGTVQNADRLFDLVKPRYHCSIFGDELTLHIPGVVQ